MPDSIDPSGSTEQFRVFAQSEEPERSRTPIVAIVVAAVVVVIAGLAWVAFA